MPPRSTQHGASKPKVQRYWVGKAPETKKSDENEKKKSSLFEEVSLVKPVIENRRKAEPVVLKRVKAQPKIVKSNKNISTKDSDSASSEDSAATLAAKVKAKQDLERRNRLAAAQAAAPDDSSSSESDSEVERRRARARAKHMARQAAQQDATALDNIDNKKDDDEEVVDDARAVAAMLSGAVRSNVSKPDDSDSDDDDIDVARKPSTNSFINKTTASATTTTNADESSSGSYEYETDSEDEIAPLVTFRPTFVRKKDRVTKDADTVAIEAEQKAQEHEEKLRLLRRQEAKSAVVKDLENEAAMVRRAAGGQHADDDGLDADPQTPEEAAEEHAAWRVRELARVQRELNAMKEEREEKEAIARRRNMTDAEIEIEDRELLEARKKKGKGKMRFMQKYYHEGAFYRGGDEGDILEGRDFTAPTEADAVDKTALPEVMQKVRRGFGLAGHSRYTHLADQDTSKKDDLWFQDKKLANKYKHKMSGTRAVSENKRRRR